MRLAEPLLIGKRIFQPIEGTQRGFSGVKLASPMDRPNEMGRIRMVKGNDMKLKILGLVAMGLLAVGPVKPTFASIVFDFAGTCEVSCARFGLSDGTAFNQIGALRLRDGTNTAAGSNLLLSDFESFNLFGLDFLTGNVLQLATAGVGFSSNDVLSGFTLIGGTNWFCYHRPNSTCANGRFDTVVGSIGTADGLEGHGPGVFTRQTVPEPGTLALLGLGLAGLGLSRRRKA